LISNLIVASNECHRPQERKVLSTEENDGEIRRGVTRWHLFSDAVDWERRTRSWDASGKKKRRPARRFKKGGGPRTNWQQKKPCNKVEPGPEKAEGRSKEPKEQLYQSSIALWNTSHLGREGVRGGRAQTHSRGETALVQEAQTDAKKWKDSVSFGCIGTDI